MPSLDISILSYMRRTFFVDCSLLFILLHTPICFPSKKCFDINKKYFIFIKTHGCGFVFAINGIGALIGAHFLADDDYLIDDD